jgi:hypothetical protein
MVLNLLENKGKIEMLKPSRMHEGITWSLLKILLDKIM